MPQCFLAFLWQVEKAELEVPKTVFSQIHWHGKESVTGVDTAMFCSFISM
jgi:hypothetical protein